MNVKTKYNPSKINQTKICIAKNFGVQICELMIPRYAIYGKCFNFKMLYNSLDKKRRNGIKKTENAAGYYYFYVTDKQGLLAPETPIAIKILMPDMKTFRKVYIYGKSQLANYIRSNSTSIQTMPEWNKPIEYNRYKGYNAVYAATGMRYNNHISYTTTPRPAY